MIHADEYEEYTDKDRPQIKICGITSVKHAIGCVELGADAIGCVFYEKSPRNLTFHTAEAICEAVKDKVTTVGVFVNASFSEIIKTVYNAGLNAVQLHGQESPELVLRLLDEGLPVFKVLFDDGEPPLESVNDYKASAYLVECGKGKLPGGNAQTWNWGNAKAIGESNPLILAGGLSLGTIDEAVASALPDAIDVSSGVEATPGVKDLDKVKYFIETVSECKCAKQEFRKVY